MKRYTLVEILVSIAVIAILFGMAIGATSFVKTKIARSSTQATMKLIEMAFQKYKNEIGMYPHQITKEPQELYLPKPSNYFSSSPSTDSLKINLWKYFNDVTADDSNPKIRGIPLRYDSSTGRCYIVDGWGNRIVYICPGVFNTESFDLLSRGGDDKFDCTGSSATPSRDSGTGNVAGWTVENIADDITNFTKN